MSQPLVVEGLGRMSSMMLLQEEIWLGGAGAVRFQTSSGRPRLTRPTKFRSWRRGTAHETCFASRSPSLASVSMGLWSPSRTGGCRSRQPVGRATFQAELRARRRGRGAQELERPVKQATVKTVRIVNGETAKMREVFKTKRATVSDAE